MSLKVEIKKAIGDHGLWKKMLKDAVDRGTIDDAITTLKDDKQCSFGKWLTGPSITVKEKDSDHYHTVRELHATFHEQASKVAQLAGAGHKTGALRMLETNGEFTKASAALTTAMLTWLKEAQ